MRLTMLREIAAMLVAAVVLFVVAGLLGSKPARADEKSRNAGVCAIYTDFMREEKGGAKAVAALSLAVNRRMAQAAGSQYRSRLNAVYRANDLRGFLDLLEDGADACDVINVVADQCDLDAPEPQARRRDLDLRREPAMRF